MALYSRIWKVGAGLLTAGMVLALLTEPTMVLLGPLAAAAALRWRSVSGCRSEPVTHISHR